MEVLGVSTIRLLAVLGNLSPKISLLMVSLIILGYEVYDL